MFSSRGIQPLGRDVVLLLPIAFSLFSSSFSSLFFSLCDKEVSAGESSIGDVRDDGDVDRVGGGRGDCIRGLVGGGGDCPDVGAGRSENSTLAIAMP